MKVFDALAVVTCYAPKVGGRLQNNPQHLSFHRSSNFTILFRYHVRISELLWIKIIAFEAASNHFYSCYILWNSVSDRGTTSTEEGFIGRVMNLIVL